MQKLRDKSRPQSNYWIEEAKFYRDQTFATERWILAAQLSIASGGIITILNADSIDDQSRFFALVWFFTGLMCILLLAFLQGNAQAYTHSYLSKAARALEDFAASGDIKHLPNAIDSTSETKAKRYEILVELLYFVPFISITIAAFITIDGVK